MQSDILVACTILLIALAFAQKTKWVVRAGNVLCILIIVQVALSPFHLL